MTPTAVVTEPVSGGPLKTGEGVERAEAARDTGYREAAYRAFIDGVSLIKDASVEFDPGRPLVGQSIRVYVPSQDSLVWNLILDIEAAVALQYPRSGLDVWISDFRPASSENA